jgi:deoxyuridine 5'-triphosphate nucleotidohydrolase
MADRTYLQKELQAQGTLSDNISHAMPQYTTCQPISMDPSDDLGSTLQIVKLSDKATTPQRATPDAAGYDLHSTVTIDIQPRTTVPIRTDIALRPPPNTYCQILSRTGMVFKHGIEIKAGTIDRDYTGNVTVLLHNTTDQPYHPTLGMIFAPT